MTVGLKNGHFYRILLIGIVTFYMLLLADIVSNGITNCLFKKSCLEKSMYWHAFLCTMNWSQFLYFNKNSLKFVLFIETFNYIVILFLWFLDKLNGFCVLCEREGGKGVVSYAHVLLFQCWTYFILFCYHVLTWFYGNISFFEPEYKHIINWGHKAKGHSSVREFDKMHFVKKIQYIHVFLYPFFCP